MAMFMWVLILLAGVLSLYAAYQLSPECDNGKLNLLNMNIDFSLHCTYVYLGGTFLTTMGFLGFGIELLRGVV